MIDAYDFATVLEGLIVYTNRGLTVLYIAF